MTADEMHDENMKEFAEALGECAEACVTKRAKHTPGPWFVNGPWHIQSDTKLAVPSIVGNVLQPRNGDIQEREANANLIAAAPELLEALENILIYLGDWDTDDEECVAARAAIAKAKGVPAG